MRRRRHDEVTQQIERARRRPARSPSACRRSAASRCAPRRRRGTATSAAAASTAGAATPRGSTLGSAPPRRLPVMTPSGRPTSVANSERGQREDRGVGGAFRNQIADRPAVLQRVAEIEPHRRRQPVAVLRGDRLVEAVARALPARASRRRADAERVGDEVAGRQPREHQRRRRHGEHQKQREGEAPREIARQRTDGHRVGPPEQLRAILGRRQVGDARRRARRRSAARRNTRSAGARRRSSALRRTASCARPRPATRSAASSARRSAAPTSVAGVFSSRFHMCALPELNQKSGLVPGSRSVLSALK